MLMNAIQANVKSNNGTFVTFETSWIIQDSWLLAVDFKIMILSDKGKIDAYGDYQSLSISSKKLGWPFTLGLQEIQGKKLVFSKNLPYIL